ncbi:MAG: GNAT family N-acetyltransferase [Proteobacteria bacterium]|uniref:GNAT family N-acetyltransferase n=1 Tax=Brevundimonas sp. TaxID=1871086 RepID=UPI000DB6B64F|nr:GNAT family protein [Brevundimonas sp.]MBN9466138.1 GNAT family N-acetyltransferase [Brevundimonas sp.]MCA0367894.1 GNAT family N-acetyltransferase [Pseudomonadota bacterium]PZU75700.1 MAG: 30S ribosomal protein S5 alanine N-acetyltransferase [Brevundimonas sp.]
MALLDWMSDVAGPVVRGDGVLLRPPRAADHAAWSVLRDGSRDYLQPWEPAWPDDDLTKAAFRRRLSIYAREMELGNAWPFFVFIDEGRTLVGAVTLSNVRRGVAETGTLGYWIGRPFAGRGHTTAAVRGVVGFAFDRVKLHRLEAACLPTNLASRRVLEKSGFRNEGRARAYLKINGEWADHLLFGLVEDEFDRTGRDPSS